MTAAWLESFKKTLFPSEDDKYADRRKTVRIKRQIGVLWKTANGESRATVVDISEGGMRLETRVGIQAGSVLPISRVPVAGCSPRQPVRCLVRWVRPADTAGRILFGVEFQEPPEIIRSSWVQGVLKEGASASAASARQKRRHRRLPCRIATEVWGDWGEKITDGFVTDLSFGGAGLEMPDRAAPEMKLELRIGPFEDLGVLQLMTRVVGAREVTQETRRGPQRKYIHGTSFFDLTSTQRRLLVRFLQALGKPPKG